MNQGDTWSICAAMSLKGWLPCTGIRKGYFNKDEFYDWILNALLPALLKWRV
jgi:hypothetical protein